VGKAGFQLLHLAKTQKIKATQSQGTEINQSEPEEKSSQYKERK